jgi:hypothetical protein
VSAQKLARRVAVVEYEDGRIEEYDFGKPIYEYQVSRLGVDLTTDSVDAGFWTLWFAAGKPGADGDDDALTLETARPKLEAWLTTITNTDFVERRQAPAAKPKPRRAAASK